MSRKNLYNLFAVLETLLGIIMIINLIMSIFLSLSTIVIVTFLIGIIGGYIASKQSQLGLDLKMGPSRFISKKNRSYEQYGLDHIDYIESPSVKLIIFYRERLIKKQKYRDYQNKKLNIKRGD